MRVCVPPHYPSSWVIAYPRDIGVIPRCIWLCVASIVIIVVWVTPAGIPPPKASKQRHVLLYERSFDFYFWVSSDETRPKLIREIDRFVVFHELSHFRKRDQQRNSSKSVVDTALRPDRSVLIDLSTVLALYEGRWSDSVDFSNVISSPTECEITAFGTVKNNRKKQSSIYKFIQQVDEL